MHIQYVHTYYSKHMHTYPINTLHMDPLHTYTYVGQSWPRSSDIQLHSWQNEHLLIFERYNVEMQLYVTSIAFGGLLCYGIPSTAFQRKHSEPVFYEKHL